MQPVELVPDVYSACNLCLIPLKKGVIGNGFPSKSAILMACKRVIVNSVEIDSVYAKMFRENNMGVSVDVYDYDGLAREIKRLYREPKTVAEMADNAYRFGKAHYSSTQSTRKLMDIFEEVGKR